MENDAHYGKKKLLHCFHGLYGTKLELKKVFFQVQLFIHEWPVTT
jgi:hypothetical protein